MYRIAKEKEQTGRAVAFKGGSIRDISLSAGIARMTAWRIWKDVRREVGVIYCECGKVAGHKEWCNPRIARSPNRIGWLMGALSNIATLNIYIPTRPRYERPEIPNERETEIPLLINRRHIRSLDAPVFDGNECGHTVFKSDQMTPLEILLLKEEQQSEEYLQRGRRIAEWNRWRERKSSAFSIT